MKLLAAALVIATAAADWTQPPKPDYDYLGPSEGYANYTEEVVNGYETGDSTWRGVVMVNNGCTGSLIHPSVVSCAAHCCRSGMSITTGSRGQVSLGRAADFQNYSSGSNDFCLIRLETPATNYPIYETASSSPSGAGTIVGYGVNVQGYPQSGFGTRRYGNVRVTSVSGYDTRVTNNNSGGPAQNACNGDSGGPLFTSSGPRLQVSGVTSRGAAGCPPSQNVIYTGVPANSNNIHSTMSRWNIEFQVGSCPVSQCCYNANC